MKNVTSFENVVGRRCRWNIKKKNDHYMDGIIDILAKIKNRSL